MPLQPWTNVISVDDHLIEHPLAWHDRLPRGEARERLAAEIESESAALAALGADLPGAGRCTAAPAPPVRAEDRPLATFSPATTHDKRKQTVQ